MTDEGWTPISVKGHTDAQQPTSADEGREITGYALSADFEPEDGPDGFIEWSFLVPRNSVFGAGVYRISFERPLNDRECDGKYDAALQSTPSGSGEATSLRSPAPSALTSDHFRRRLRHAVDLANETIPPGNVYTIGWLTAHGFSNSFVASLAKAIFDVDDALDDALSAEGTEPSTGANGRPAGHLSPEPPQPPHDVREGLEEAGKVLACVASMKAAIVLDEEFGGTAGYQHDLTFAVSKKLIADAGDAHAKVAAALSRLDTGGK